MVLSEMRYATLVRSPCYAASVCSRPRTPSARIRSTSCNLLRSVARNNSEEHPLGRSRKLPTTAKQARSALSNPRMPHQSDRATCHSPSGHIGNRVSVPIFVSFTCSRQSSLNCSTVPGPKKKRPTGSRLRSLSLALPTRTKVQLTKISREQSLLRYTSDIVTTLRAMSRRDPAKSCYPLGQLRFGNRFGNMFCWLGHH
jgi:hypothetical protein